MAEPAPAAEPWTGLDLAKDLRLRLADRVPLNLREAAAEAGVSLTTFSRAANGWPELSHANFLKLRAWLDRKPEAQADAA